MEMSLIHAGLAAGTALAALPVILHLFMRQTPKHVVFPALRLIRERQRRSKKRLRVKNWLLLLARMALLALMALALARPRLYSQVPLGDESVPTALGLVFDTSLSMGYKDKDKTRLDDAKERAKEIIAKVPDSSLVFVVDSSQPGVPIGLPPAAASKLIDGLTIHPVNRPLNAAMGQVYEAVADCDRPVHVVHVLTDLARTSWLPDKPADGLDQVAKFKSAKGSKLATFILRLTPKDVHNVSVESADPSENVATQGQSIEITSRIRAQGPAATRLVEFYLDGIKKGDKPIEVPSEGQVEVSFATPPRMKEGDIHQGEIRLSGAPDPLVDDDQRFFTFKVRPPLKVLIVSDSEIDAEFVAYAIDPDPNPSAPRSYLLERTSPAEFVRSLRGKLDSYSCIFLLNVKQLEESDWGALSSFVHGGGGLVVAPGHLSDPENYNGPIAAQILPAQLEAPKPAFPKTLRTSIGKVKDVTHPLFQRYGKDLDTQLAQVPVFRYWTIKPPGEGMRTLLTFADGAPALIERTFKGPKIGRVLLWTTPLSRRPNSRDPGAWNEFPHIDSGWSFMVLMDRTVSYLAGTSNETLNFEAGEDAVLNLPPNVRFTNFLVTGPDAKTTERLVPSPTNEFLQIVAPQAVGQWSVKAVTADNRSSILGFSVNPPRTESRFDPLKKEDLDVIFGKDGYVLAEDIQSYQQKESLTRFGYELFPWLMFLILIVVTLENLLANTFHKEAPPAKIAGMAT